MLFLRNERDDVISDCLIPLEARSFPSITPWGPANYAGGGAGVEGRAGVVTGIFGVASPWDTGLTG